MGNGVRGSGVRKNGVRVTTAGEYSLKPTVVGVVVTLTSFFARGSDSDPIFSWKMTLTPLFRSW